MGHVKNHNLSVFKELIDSHDISIKNRIKKKLSPEALKILENPKAQILIPQKLEEEIMIAGSAVLLPNSPNKIWELGEILAKKSMTGIYRLFLSVPSPSSAIKHASRMWEKFYNIGNVEIINVTEKSGTVLVTDFPALLPYQIELTCGYIVVILEYAGAKNVNVNFDPSNPDAWKWKVTWDL